MQVKSNKVARQLSSVPTTHRPQVLQAISDKVHSVTAEIKYLQAEGHKLRDLVRDCPDDVHSKLDWIQSRLSES
jgi:hypothetical protein